MKTGSLYSGQLEKKSPSLRGWQRRDVVLTVDMLTYYYPDAIKNGSTSSAADKLRGFIRLCDIRGVSQGDDERCFFIETKNRKWRWRAETQLLRSAWISEIREAIDRISGSGPKHRKQLSIPELIGNTFGISVKCRRVVAFTTFHGVSCGSVAFAQKHGWKLGDLILEVQGERMETQQDIVDAMKNARDGPFPVTVTVERQGLGSGLDGSRGFDNFGVSWSSNDYDGSMGSRIYEEEEKEDKNRAQGALRIPDEGKILM